MRPGKVAFGRGLLAQLLVGAVLIAAVSIAATAFLTATTTSQAIRTEQGQTAAADAEIQNQLVDYAARHPAWSDAGPTVADLAARIGRRIVLRTQDGQLIADSAAGHPPPGQLTAVIDPLNMNTQGAIADAATGPFTLTPQERATVRGDAEAYQACLAGQGVTARIDERPNGRAKVTLPGAVSADVEVNCLRMSFESPTATEQRALDQLQAAVDSCLRAQGHVPVRIDLDFHWDRGLNSVPAAPERVDACVATSRKDQLRPFVAPPALLYVGEPPGGTATGLPVHRTLGAAALVLAFTVGICFLGATRLVRPLRALTGAARRMRDGDTTARVRVAPRGEIGQLAAAFNEMTERRAQLETQRTDLISDIAHELRSPLSTIRSLLEAAEDGLVELDRELVSSLLEEALLLQHVIDDLRDLSAAEAGELRLHREDIELGGVLDQAVATHRAAADAAGVSLTVRVDGEPVLAADPVRLRQIIGNLLSNAIRHTPRDGRIVIDAHPDGPDVLIEVADTGVGIAAADLPHVFDRFWRAEKSRSRQTGGSGLGLAIVRNLVEAHDGTVTVASPPGGGTIFTIRLPSGS